MAAALNARRSTLIVAVILALGTGWLTLQYLSGVQRQSSANGAPVQVVVAAQEIPARVPITPAMLTLASRPASAVDPNALTDVKQAVGALSLITIPAGSGVTGAMVGHPADIGLPVRLKPGMRAVSVQIDKVKGISGLVQPGDRVDVIAQAPKSDAAPPPAATILRAVRVLAIGDSLEYSSATPSPQEASAQTITLEVTPKQADLLVMADINATLRLALRSPKEAVNSAPAEALHFDSTGSTAGAPAAAAPAPPPQPAVATDAALVRALALNGASAQRAEPGRRPAAITAAASPVKVIDGDHYAATGANQPVP